MNGQKIILLLFLCCFGRQVTGQSAHQDETISLKNKNILVVWGGWDGHQPDVFAKKISKWAKQMGAQVIVSDSLGVYSNKGLMDKQDLIIQYWTMGEISKEQSEG